MPKYNANIRHRWSCVSWNFTVLPQSQQLFNDNIIYAYINTFTDTCFQFLMKSNYRFKSVTNIATSQRCHQHSNIRHKHRCSPSKAHELRNQKHFDFTVPIQFDFPPFQDYIGQPWKTSDDTCWWWSNPTLTQALKIFHINFWLSIF